MEKIRNFRDLEIWKLGKNIVLDVYRVTKAFPKEEIYGLVSQMRRAAISIPSNNSRGIQSETQCGIPTVSLCRAWVLR